MAESARTGRSKDGRKKKYRSDGTPIWERRNIDGPGVWVTCVKGKERQTVGEICDLFESLAEDLWPKEARLSEPSKNDRDDEIGGEDDLEKLVAEELASMKRPKNTRRFENCHTNTPCVLFIACKAPVDPVELVYKHVREVEATGVTRTRYTHRLIPISAACVVNIPEIQSLCHRILSPIFSDSPKKYSYKIDLRVRNHTVISRQTLIQEVARCVPEGHTVDLENPELFILVEVFKSTCGISVVRDYYRLQKFNVLEIANGKNAEGHFKAGDGRVRDKFGDEEASSLGPDSTGTHALNALE